MTAEKSIVIRVSPQEFAVMRDIARCGRRDRVRRGLLDRCLRRQIRRDATMHSLNALADDSTYDAVGHACASYNRAVSLYREATGLLDSFDRDLLRDVRFG